MNHFTSFTLETIPRVISQTSYSDFKFAGCKYFTSTHWRTPWVDKTEKSRYKWVCIIFIEKHSNVLFIFIVRIDSGECCVKTTSIGFSLKFIIHCYHISGVYFQNYFNKNSVISKHFVGVWTRKHVRIPTAVTLSFIRHYVCIYSLQSGPEALPAMWNIFKNYSTRVVAVRQSVSNPVKNRRTLADRR